MKINVKGAYGESNFGDDLLMIVFENYFIENFHDLQLNFSGENADYVESLLKKSTYNENIKNADWLIYGGGTQFFAFNSKPLSFFQKVSLVITNPSLVINKLRNDDARNVAFLGFGIGPFSNNSSAELSAKERVKKARYVGVRDQVSKSFCDVWKIKSTLGADVVFSSYFKKLNLIPPKNSGEKDSTIRKVGIILRDWGWDNEGDAYISNILKFYNLHKEDPQYEFEFIIFAPKKDKKVLELVQGSKVLLWDPKSMSIETYMNRLNRFDVFISARYHGAIIGALLGKKVICIEIEDKLKILANQIPELALWEKPFDINELETLFVNSVNSLPNYSNSIGYLNTLADSMLNDFKNNLV